MLSSSSDPKQVGDPTDLRPTQPVISSSVDSSGSSSSNAFRVTKASSHCRAKSRSASGASPSQRRSSFLSACMQKETVVMQPTGTVDRYGQPTYALWVAESQGFKWNQNVYDVFEDDFDLFE